MSVPFWIPGLVKTVRADPAAEALALALGGPGAALALGIAGGGAGGANGKSARLEAIEARWSSPLTQAQLANPWQRVTIGGVTLPGLWNLRKIKRKMIAQKKKKAGTDGGNAYLRGLESAAFDLQGELYIPSHLEAWVKFVPSLGLTSPTGQTPPSERASYQIEHPLCTLNGVRFVVAVGLEYTAPMEGGPLHINIELLGTDEGVGQAKGNPQKKPVKTTSSKDTPRIELDAAGQAKQNLRQYVLPPRPER